MQKVCQGISGILWKEKDKRWKRNVLKQIKFGLNVGNMGKWPSNLIHILKRMQEMTLFFNICDTKLSNLGIQCIQFLRNFVRFVLGENHDSVILIYLELSLLINLFYKTGKLYLFEYLMFLNEYFIKNQKVWFDKTTDE